MAEQQAVNATLAQTLFVKLWLDGDWDSAATLCQFLPDKEKDKAGLAFLLDPRPLANKLSGLVPPLSQNTAYRHFIIAEHHWQKGRETDALRDYQQCLAHNSDPNAWYLSIIRSRQDQRQRIN